MTSEFKQKLLFSHPLCFTFCYFYTSHLIFFQFYTFTLSILFFTLILNLSFFFLHRLLLFLVPFSISPCKPTRSNIDCLARRIAPYTPALCCKSLIENFEVFPRKACIISEFGCSLCSCLGAGPVLQFYCCSAVTLCFRKIQGRRLAGRRDYSANTQSAGLE